MISPQIKLLLCTLVVLALVYYFFIVQGQTTPADLLFSSAAANVSSPADAQPLLADVYPVLPKPGYTDESYSTEWEGYPIHAANSIETTNYRYWSTPENGTCIPADMCYGLYGTLPPREPPAPLVAPEINDERRRVGFYQTS